MMEYCNSCTSCFICVALQGQTFIAVDPQAFAPGFEDRMGAFMTDMRTMEPVRHEAPVNSLTSS